MSRRTLFTISGIVLILGGLMALFLPMLASLTAVLIVGWTFVLAGILHIVEAFRDADDRLWNAGFGILGVLIGISFVLNPFAGLLSLTILLGAFFAASGAMQLYMAWKRRETDSVWMMALSGVLSIALAVLIAMNLFSAAVIVPGLLLALELVSTGFALILLRPNPAKQKAKPEAPGTTHAEPVIDQAPRQGGAPDADPAALTPAPGKPATG